MPLSLFCTSQKRKRPLDRVIKKLISGYYYPETESGKRNGVPKRGSIDRIIEKRKGKLGSWKDRYSAIDTGPRKRRWTTSISKLDMVEMAGAEGRTFREIDSIRSIRLTSPVIGDFSAQRAAAAPKMCTPEKSSAAAFMSRCLFKKKFMIKKKKYWYYISRCAIIPIARHIAQYAAFHAERPVVARSSSVASYAERLWSS